MVEGTAQAEVKSQNPDIESQQPEDKKKNQDDGNHCTENITVTKVGQPQPPDGGWGYVVLLGVGLGMIMVGTLNRVVPLIYQELYEKFGKSATETAWVFSVSGICTFTFSPLASICCNRFGVRASVIFGTVLSSGGLIASAWPPSLWYMYITFGIMQGIGTGFIMTSSFIIVGQYFDKYKGRAFAIASMGLGIGGITLAPLVTILFEHHGYSGTMLLLGGFLLHFLISAALFRPLNLTKKELQEMNELKREILAENAGENINNTAKEVKNGTLPKDEGNKKYKGFCAKHFNQELIREKKFMSFSFMMMGSLIGLSCLGTFIIALAKARGITNRQFAIIILTTAATDLIGRFCSGFLFDLKIVKKRRMLLFAVLGLVYSCFVSILPLAYNFTTFLVITISGTIFGSGFHAQHNTVLTDMVGKERLASAIGLSRAIMGLGSIIGPTIGGSLRDWSGEYHYTFYFSGAASGIGILMLILLNWRHVFKSQREVV